MLSPFVTPARALALALYLSTIATAKPKLAVAHPAQSQLPLVARTSQPYSWTLRNDTFLPAPPKKLVARELPAWLAFDADSLTFSGVVPAASDIPEGELAPIQLIADGDGDEARDTLVLYVSSLEPPVVAKPIAGQLRPHAPPLASVFLLSPGSALASPFERGLRVPPGWSFSIGWDGDTFVFPGGDDVFYAARLANGDPLPGWMTYDRYTMTFVGVAPNLPAPAVFDVVLYGGDAPGYQAVHDSFALAVAAHELAWDPKTVDVGAPLFAGVTLDGAPITDDAGARYTVQTGVDWLSFNATTRALVGAPPAGYAGPPVVAHATVALDGQTVRADVPVNVPGLAAGAQATTLPPLVVRPGADVDYDLGADARVAPGPLPGAPWLHAEGSQLKGTAPADAGSVVASVPLLGHPAAATLNVTVSPTLPVSVPVPAHPSTPDGDSKKLAGGPRGGVNKAVLAACVGALLGFGLLCTFAACCRKFCAVRDDVRPGSPRVRDLEFGEKALERTISPSSTISVKAAKVLGIGIESPPLPSFPSGKPALTAGEVKALPTSSAKSAFFRRLRHWQEHNGPMAPEMDARRPVIRDAHELEEDDEHPYEGVVELAREGVEASPSGSTVTGRSAVSYDCTTDTSSTLSEPLEAEHETPRRRRDFGPGPGPSPAREHGSIIRTAARVTRAGEFVASAVREGTPELVSGVRLVSLSGVVDSAPRLAGLPVGRGIAAGAFPTPSADPRVRAFGQMQLIEPQATAARESALSYLTTSSAAEDADEDEDPAVALARRALHMGRGAPLR